ncbi:MAG TPA: tetratricopeptide repeat protein [Urbifossiella sp.]|jgi:tetratricopeptide (TPR) repeat protein
MTRLFSLNHPTAYTARLAVFAFLAFSAIASAEEAPVPGGKAPATSSVPRKMFFSGLAPAKPMFDACVYHYGVGTTNPRCQAFVDQGLGMYYSYVYIEAARCFETATELDPDCAYAWLMLSRSLERFGRGAAAPNVTPHQAALGGLAIPALPDRLTRAPIDYALDMANKLMPKASDREQLLIKARLQEKGIWPGTPPDQRNKRAAASLDELLTLYDDDQEGWFWRSQVAEGMNGKVPFFKALLRVNPLHPGANHELVHFYEAIKRPALGWPFAEGYIKSSPGIPHAFHMQAHLATRIGKWGPTSDWSWKAVEMQKQYHAYQGVAPYEDYQFNHHMATLTLSLVHDGRFAETKAIMREAEDKYKYSFKSEWFRMYLGEGNWAEAQKIAEFFRKGNKANGAYHAAMLYLEKGDTDRVGPEIDVLRQAQQSRRRDRDGERRMWEVQGRYLCQTGHGDAGLKLLKKCVDTTKNDYGHHAWGNGAVLMESWGAGAMECGNAAEAEEALQEALAHDAGSVRGALGLWAVCERLGRTEEAERYLKLAHRCWAKAEPKDFERLKASFAAKAARIGSQTANNK